MKPSNHNIISGPVLGNVPLLPGPVSTDYTIEMPGPVAENTKQEFATFQVGSGLSKEEEFKRLTGEEWPGQKYYAVPGDAAENYDEPIENWLIYERDTDILNQPQATDQPNQSIDQDNPQGDQDQAQDPKNEVEIGDIVLLDLNEYLPSVDSAKLTEAEAALEQLRPKLTELYAQNRSLTRGAVTQANFREALRKYEVNLTEYNRCKSEAVYRKEGEAIIDGLAPRIEELRTEITEKLTEFAGGDLKHTDKTQAEINQEKSRLIEEAKQIVTKEWDDAQKDLETKVNVAALQGFLDHKCILDKDTNDTIDQGNEETGRITKGYRRFVNKVINNRHLRAVLTATAAAGLAVSGVGLAVGLVTGTMAIGVSSTISASSIAFGAAKGGVSGFLMSRQNSQSSTFRGKLSEEEVKAKMQDVDVASEITSKIKARLQGIKKSDENSAFAKMAGWVVNAYDEASQQDAANNRKRTLVATGLGAAIGAFTSIFRINKVDQQPAQSTPSQPATKPSTTTSLNQPTPKLAEAQQPITQTHYTAKQFDNVNVPKGRGIYEVFRQMGGQPEDAQKALEIARSFDVEYGVVSDASGIRPIGNSLADVYPGSIESWPEVAKSYITDISSEWAKQNIVPRVETTTIIPADAAINSMATTTASAATTAATAANQTINTVISSTSTVDPIYNAREVVTNAFIPEAFRNFLSRRITPAVDRAIHLGDVAVGILAGTIPKYIEESAVQPVQEYADAIFNGNSDDKAQFSRLWQRLEPNTKEEIIQIEKGRSGNPNGFAFRTWLKEEQHIAGIEP